MATKKKTVETVSESAEAVTEAIEAAQATDVQVETKTASTGENKASETVARKNVYRTQAGDTVAAIAEKYGTTVQAIIDLNDLTTKDAVPEGKLLRVPPNSGLFVGCRVRIKRTARLYATGNAIDDFLRGTIHTVEKLDGDRCRLSNLNSWMNVADVTLL